MRIAHVVWGMDTGGIETMLVNIINEQVKTEKIALFIINNIVEESIMAKLSPNCLVKRFNRKPGSKGYLKIAKLNFELIRYRPDIIHLHSRHVSEVIYGRWNMVRTIHNSCNNADEFPRMKALYAISKASQDGAAKRGYPNVPIVNNGIKIDEFKCKDDYSVRDGVYHFVQVGRLYDKQKGQKIMIDAIHRLVNEYHITNFMMHFIGDGPDREKLMTQALNLGLEKYVTFEGTKTQDYLKEHLCDYDLFIQPSRFEGFGLTVAEAIAAKVPVLVSNIEGPFEIIGNGMYGMTFQKGNSDDLANKLYSFIQNGYEISLISLAYKYVKDNYDVAVTAKMYLEEYKKTK